VDCCLREDGSLLPDRWKANLPGGKTELQHSKCYASALANCSSQISREHFISEGVLELAGDDGFIEMGGLAWQPTGERKRLSTSNLAANILCKRHNEGLSGIDSVGIDFFEKLLYVNKSFSKGDAEGEEAFLFNGHDVERWILKTLCGTVASGNAETEGYDVSKWTPPIHWLEILFGDEEMPEGCGMYYLSRVGDRRNLAQSVSFSPLSNPGWGVYGAILVLNGHEFVLAMRPPETRQNTILEHSVYRPLELVMRSHSGKRIIIFGWKIQGDQKTIRLDYKQ
jgi:hypothetical protein